MIALNLETKTREQELIKTYLEENASEILAEKINNGTPIEKDGKMLTNRKTLDGFMTFAAEEARKRAVKGARSACVEDATVYGWAIHYFEEDSIEGTLYNADGTEYKPPKPKYEPKGVSKPAEPTTPQPRQQTLFDLMPAHEAKPEEPEQSEEPIEPVVPNEEAQDGPSIDEIADALQKALDERNDKPIAPPEQTEETDEADEDDNQPSEEELQEIFRELAEEEAKAKAAKQIERPQGSPLYQRYTEIQKQYPDAVVALRLGDFYEVFGEKAVLLASELDLILTGRDLGLPERVPMIGFPYHAADTFFGRISEKHLLAIAETLDDFKLLPATVMEQDYLIDTETGEILKDKENVRVLDKLLDGKLLVR